MNMLPYVLLALSIASAGCALLVAFSGRAKPKQQPEPPVYRAFDYRRDRWMGSR